MKLRLGAPEIYAIVAASALIWLPLLVGSMDSAAFIRAGNSIEGSSSPHINSQTSGNDYLIIVGVVISFGNLGVVAFQSWLFRRQTNLMEKQTKIANQSYIAAHRPKLIVRDAHLVPDTTADDSPLRTYSVHYRLTNVGGSKANITGAGFASHKWKRIYRPFMLGLEGEVVPVVTSLEAGESFEDVVPVQISFPELNEIMASYELERMKSEGISPYDLIFRGGIDYADENGIKRRTAVWRVCEGVPSLRMRPVDDLDYEYAD